MQLQRLLGYAYLTSLLTISQAANAIAIYTYQGNDFYIFDDNTPPSGSFNSSQSISVTFKVADPILNAVGLSIIPLEFSINDGVNEIDNTSNSEVTLFILSTDASGQIHSWDISVFEKEPYYTSGWSIGDTNRRMYTNSMADLTYLEECGQIDSTGVCSLWYSDFALSNNPGLWTLTTVPLPSAIWLFCSGLLGLIGVSKRKKAV